MEQATGSQGQAHGTLLDAVVIGSGFGGLCMGIKLKQAGMHEFVILERAQSIGGTWRDNTYPGCACDVQSHLYSFSFEQNADWTRTYAAQGEIRAYLEHCASKYELRSHLRFGQDVQRADYDEDSGTWTVSTVAGESYRARQLVSAMGAFSNPSIPKLPGIERFRGKTFHSSRWDHEYELSGKRVAVVGTGASAIQFVPQIVPQVAHLDLYQRSAPWIMGKPDRPIGGTVRGIFRVLPLLMWLYRLALYTMLESRVLGFINPSLMKQVETLAKWHLRAQVPNRELRSKLKPSYTIGCKRVLLSNDYYRSLAREHVDVVTSGIREVREHSIVTTDGVEREVDAIIYGTGFEVQQMMPRGKVFGIGGRDIVDSWSATGIEAYKGIHVAGFPNMHLILGPNTGLGHSSIVYMIESQVAYIMQSIGKLRSHGWKSLDVTPEAQRVYNETLQTKHTGNVWLSGCKSWYVDERGRNTTLWPGFTFSYRRQTSSFVTSAYRIEPVGSTRRGVEAGVTDSRMERAA